MRRWTNEVIVGASIIAAIIVTMFGYVYLREIPVRQQGYEITIIFNNVTGLETGDAVTVSGLKVGRVQEMKLMKGHVKVRVWMNGEVPFSKDSRAAIRSVGMIGEKYIDLMPGSSDEFLQEGDTVIGTYISDLADSGGGVNELMEQTNELLIRLNTVIDSALNKDAQKAISETLVNTGRITSELNKNLNQNMNHLGNTLAHLDTLSLAFKNYWDQHRTAIDSISQNMAQSTSELPMIVAKLDSSLTTTQKLLAAIERQQGAVGKALYDTTLYVKANKTIDEVQTLLNDVKKNPSKYLQISVIDLF